MARILICDRCGAEIAPSGSGKRLQLDRYGAPDGAPDSVTADLCMSCVMQLRKWLKEDKPHADE